MQTYFGKLERLIVDYNTHMPFTSDAKMFHKQPILYGPCSCWSHT